MVVTILVKGGSSECDYHYHSCGGRYGHAPGDHEGYQSNRSSEQEPWPYSRRCAFLVGLDSCGGTCPCGVCCRRRGPRGSISTSQAVFSFASIVLGCSAFPFFLRVFAYGPNAQMKAWGWKGLGWIFIANSVGILILLGAVATGVQVYDWK